MRHESDWWLGGFIAGFLVGFLLGFVYTRLVPDNIHPTPAQLAQADKELYLTLIAAAYRYDGNLDKASGRLDRLEVEDINQTITDLAQRYIDIGADARDIRSLAVLAAGLGSAEGSLLVYLSTPTQTATPIPTATFTPTATPIPTSTPTPPPPVATPTESSQNSVANPTFTPRTPPELGGNRLFQLAQSIALCDNTVNRVLRIYVQDSGGDGIPGVEVLVKWPTGQDNFFTGLKSRSNAGYADFQMEAGVTYQVELRGGQSTIATDINQAADTLCPDLPDGILPSWQVVFQQSNDATNQDNE